MMSFDPLKDSEKFSRLYGSYYYANDCGRPYQRDESWLSFFDRIAKRIIDDIQPKTVLDAGCAFGFLVECLRKRGVESWGMDISPFAIEQVASEIRPYCHIGSLTQPFPDSLPETFDLVVTIEVLEHLPPEQAELALNNICRATQDVLFSASYQDYRETTHLNVQTPDYWVQQFARLGFFRDVGFDTEFITPWAMRFRKGVEPLHRVVREYERRLRMLQTEVYELRGANLELIRKLEDFTQKLPNPLVLNELSDDYSLNTLELQLLARVKELEDEIMDWNSRWADAQSGAGWRMLEAFRGLRLSIIPSGSKQEKLLYRLIHPNRS